MMTEMIKTGSIALLASVALAAPVGAQVAPQPRTQTFTIEGVVLQVSGGNNETGSLLLMDFHGRFSALKGHIRNTSTGAIRFQCTSASSNGTAPVDVPPGERRDFDVVQVGPFAQQATGDIEPIAGAVQECGGDPPQTLSVVCPYQGVPAPKAPHHISFRHSGNYVGANGLPSSYLQVGDQDLVGGASWKSTARPISRRAC